MPEIILALASGLSLFLNSQRHKRLCLFYIILCQHQPALHFYFIIFLFARHEQYPLCNTWRCNIKHQHILTLCEICFGDTDNICVKIGETVEERLTFVVCSSSWNVHADDVIKWLPVFRHASTHYHFVVVYVGAKMTSTQKSSYGLEFYWTWIFRCSQTLNKQPQALKCDNNIVVHKKIQTMWTDGYIKVKVYLSLSLYLYVYIWSAIYWSNHSDSPTICQKLKWIIFYFNKRCRFISRILIWYGNILCLTFNRLVFVSSIHSILQ